MIGPIERIEPKTVGGVCGGGGGGALSPPEFVCVCMFLERI